MIDIDTLNRSVQAKLLALRSAESRLETEQAAFEKAEKQKSLIEDAKLLVLSVATTIQQRAHEHIARVVTRCLQAVFDDPYEFRVVFERKRGQTEARFVFHRDGSEIDPLTAAGGGVVDVAAFGLRLACLLLSKPRRQKVLLLDEPFRFVSRNYSQNLVNLLEQLSTEMGVQIIMITHSADLELGKAFRIDV